MICTVGGDITIGVSPEHNARKFEFNIGRWQRMWPEGTPHVIIQRPGKFDSYAAEGVTVDGAVLTWTPSGYDTEHDGVGKMWIAFINGDELLGLTPVTVIRIAPGPRITDGSRPSSGGPPWAEELLEAIKHAEETAERAEEAARHAQEALDSLSEAKLDKDLGVQLAGTLLFVGADGMIATLRIGSGLAIVNGALCMTGAAAPQTQILFADQGGGLATISGAEFADQGDGTVLLGGAQFTVQSDGSVLLM